MHVAVVSMVRNAIDLVDDFLAHYLTLADRIHVVDHLSDDGAYELLRVRAQQDPRVTVATLDYEPFLKSAVLTALAKRAVADGADWVLPLDVDEFLPYDSGEALRSALSDAGSELVRFEWLNCVAQVVPSENGPMDWSEPFLSIPSAPASSKIGVASGLVVRRGFRVGRGSHGIVLGSSLPPEPQLIGRLLHFPIRSMAQARTKFEQYGRSYKALYPDMQQRTKNWFAYRELFRGAPTVLEAQSIALRYPKKDVAHVGDRTANIAFQPNHRFSERPDLTPSGSRAPQQLHLFEHEVDAIIRSGEVVLRPVPLWRTRRLLDGTRVFLRRVQGWLTVRLRSA